MKISIGKKKTFLPGNILLSINKSVEKVILINPNTDLNKINKFDRVYIGSEFCQNLLPSHSEFKKILTKIDGKDISFITPPVNEAGLQKIDATVKYLVKYIKNFEVVINDFGVLSLIHTKYPFIEPVMGRIISKHIISLGTNYFIKDTETIKKLNKDYNISRIEIDNRGKNTTIEIPKNINFLKVSIYYPFLFISTTKKCIFPHLLSQKNEKIENYHCNKECLSINKLFTMKYPTIKENIY